MMTLTYVVNNRSEGRDFHAILESSSGSDLKLILQVDDALDLGQL